VSVAYTLTPLHPEAEAFVEEFLDPRHYARMIDEWQAATSAALARVTAAGMAAASAAAAHRSKSVR